MSEEKSGHWSKKNPGVALILAICGATALAATYTASCNCGNPTSPPAPLLNGEGGVVPLSPYGGKGDARPHSSEWTGDRGQPPVSSLQSALLSTATTDADFLTANRGYGVVEDTSVSAGIIRRTLGLPSFGLANANLIVEAGQRQSRVLSILAAPLAWPCSTRGVGAVRRAMISRFGTLSFAPIVEVWQVTVRSDIV